jgi:hypothetical protein
MALARILLTASITVTGTLVGAAIQRGALKGVGDDVSLAGGRCRRIVALDR